MKKLVCPKIATKLFLDFCPDFFLAFWGLPGSFFGLPVGFLFHDITKEAQKGSRKPPRSCKKFQGKNPEIISLLFWDKLIFHKDIKALSDL